MWSVLQIHNCINCLCMFYKVMLNSHAVSRHVNMYFIWSNLIPFECMFFFLVVFFSEPNSRIPEASVSTDKGDGHLPSSGKSHNSANGRTEHPRHQHIKYSMRDKNIQQSIVPLTEGRLDGRCQRYHIAGWCTSPGCNWVLRLYRSVPSPFKSFVVWRVRLPLTRPFYF